MNYIITAINNIYKSNEDEIILEHVFYYKFLESLIIYYRFKPPHSHHYNEDVCKSVWNFRDFTCQMQLPHVTEYFNKIGFKRLDRKVEKELFCSFEEYHIKLAHWYEIDIEPIVKALSEAKL